ncbi:MAG: glycosyltransferase family 4 protein [Acidobacteriota bacterium]
MNRLRFCFITTFYPPYHFGGDGIAVQRLARALVARGHHVTVVHDVDAFDVLRPDTAGPLPEPPEPPGLDVVRLRSGVGLLSTLLTQQTGRPILNGRRIRAILDEGRFDVVNFNNISLIGGPGLLAYAPEAVRVYFAHEHWLVCPTHVLWRHNREVCTGRECLRCSLAHGRPPQLWRFTGYLEKQLRHVDVFIAMSEFSRDKHREFGFPRDMEVLPYFLPDPDPDLDPVAPGSSDESPHPRPYFLFVGRLERIKGLDDVIPAFERYRDADLLIAGDGDHGPALKGLAGDNPRITFLGRIDVASLEQYYRHAIALIVPSVCFETFGIILIESFKQATPVIARRIGPFPEIVQQSCGGELFDTEQELVAAMARLQNDVARRETMGAAGYEGYRTRWSESQVVPCYLDIVRRAETRDRAGRRPSSRFQDERREE